MSDIKRKPALISMLLLSAATVAAWPSCSLSVKFEMKEEVCNGLDDNGNGEIDEGVFGVVSGSFVPIESVENVVYYQMLAQDGIIIIVYTAKNIAPVSSQRVFYLFYDYDFNLLEGPSLLSDEPEDHELQEYGGLHFFNGAYFIVSWVDRTIHQSYFRGINLGYRGEILHSDPDYALKIWDKNGYYIVKYFGAVFWYPPDCFGWPPCETLTNTIAVGYMTQLQDTRSYHDIYSDETLVGFALDYVDGTYTVLYPRCNVREYKWQCDDLLLFMFQRATDPETFRTIHIEPDDIYPGIEDFGYGYKVVFKEQENIYAFMDMETVPDERKDMVLRIPLSYPEENVELYDLASGMADFCKEPEFRVGHRGGRIYSTIERGDGDYLQLWKCGKYRPDPENLDVGEEIEDESYLIYTHAASLSWPYRRTGRIMPEGEKLGFYSANYLGDGTFLLLYSDGFSGPLYAVKLGCLH